MKLSRLRVAHFGVQFGTVSTPEVLGGAMVPPSWLPAASKLARPLSGTRASPARLLEAPADTAPRAFDGDFRTNVPSALTPKVLLALLPHTQSDPTTAPSVFTARVWEAAAEMATAPVRPGTW